MTWTNTHTIAASDYTDNPAAFEYLFDTYLPSITGWATSAHPDASTYKRSFNYTATDNFTNTSQTSYFWTTWSSSTNSSGSTIYEDAIFTTTPGDLGTNSTNALTWSQGNTIPDFNKPWRFWISDQNSRASLVTRGKAIVWFHPGYSNWNFIQNGTWTAGNHNPNSCIWPTGPGSTTLPHTNAPIIIGNSSIEYSVNPDCYYGNAYCIDLPEVFFSNFSFKYSSYGPAFICNQSDIKYHMPASGGSSANRTLKSSYSGVLIEANGRFWLRGNTDMSLASLVLDMGVTEPDLS